MKLSIRTAWLAAAGAASLAGGSPLAAGGTSSPTSVVPLDVQFGRAPTAVSGEGSDHLLYEMRLTNFSGREVTLKSIDVVDDGTGETISSHTGKELSGMIGTPGRSSKGLDRLVIPSGSFAIVFFDTTLARTPKIGMKLRHVIRVDGADTPNGKATRTELHPDALATDRREPLIIGAPLQGAGWLAANALSNTADHRRTIAVVNGRARIAQRYAIDFVQLDAKGRAYSGDPARNENWTGYGAPVLAVADGVVESVKDDLPDNQPLREPVVEVDLETIGGNHVVLALAGGQRVFYGHLKPGSVRVRKGQKVNKGDTLAALGNSGQSDAPHLHIHVADGASALGAEGLAFEFHAFHLQGHVPSLEVLESPTGWQRPRDFQANPRRRELPLENAVIDFSAD